MAHTGCSKFRRRTEQEEASARETEAAFFAVLRASNEEKRRARYTMECDACDGCGWHEGGETLKTECRKCGGTGVVASGASA